MKYTIGLLIGLSLLLSSCSTEDPKPDSDVIVIGGGLMGSSTAWQLSKLGYNVILLEKQDSVYNTGSSLGEARIARSNNRGNDIWSYLHNQSLKETEDLIAFLNEENTEEVFSMEDIYTTSPVTYVGRMRIYDKLFASLERQKVDYDLITDPIEADNKFGINLPDSVLVQREYNLHSGTLNPQQLISHLHKAVRKKGNQVLYQTKVLGLTYNSMSSHYEVYTQNEQTGISKVYKAPKIVSAAGPYTGTLLKDMAPYLDSLINPQRVFLAFLKIKAETYASLSEADRNKLLDYYPVINSSKGTRDGSFFSMIEYFDENDHPVIKIGGHFQRSDIEDLDQIWQKKLTNEEISWSVNSTIAYFQLLNLPIELDDLEFVNGYSCVYSLTKTEVPIVSPLVKEDQSPNSDFIVLAGMSGVGAKGAMTYGLIAAEWMTENSLKDSLHLITKEELGFNRLLKDIGH